jgi:hypothetical protein
MAYPISRGRFINVAAFEVRPHEEGTHFGGPWVVDVDPSYVTSLFQGWEKDVGELIQVRVQPLVKKHGIHNAHDVIPVYGWPKNIPLGCPRPADPTFLRSRKRSYPWGCRRHLFPL